MPEYKLDDTIAAVVTPLGEGGIAVIRLSGPLALDISEKIFKSHKNIALKSCDSHTIHLGVIQDSNQHAVDQALVSLFLEPNSYTGENVVEISCHGGMAVTKSILDLVVEAGARYAEPGEFTKRAFLNGKIDLTQAEAVQDLIEAKTKKSLDVALNQLTGSLSQTLKALKDRIMKLYAHMEAFLDFPEDDIEIYNDGKISDTLVELQQEITTLVKGFKRGAILREGVSVVLAGKPNAGKSSLFNALLERDRALVSSIPGTTRDHLEEMLEIEGVPIRLIDTAGLARGLESELDKIGMERTKQTFERAQLYLFLVDGSEGLEEADKLTFQSLNSEVPMIPVLTKSDQAKKIDENRLKELCGSDRYISISALKREGLEELEQAILREVVGEKMEFGEEQITRLRHKQALEAALEALKRAKSGFEKKESLEFVIVEMKAALSSLQELIGEVYSEDLLDMIFSEFCIGK